LLLDTGLVFVLASALLAVGGGRPLWSGAHGQTLGRIAAAVLASTIYYVPAMRLTDGRTAGKRAMGIRVVRADRLPMTASLGLWREAVLKVALIDVIGLVPGVGSAFAFTVLALDVGWPLIDVDSRAIHDLLARTRVIFDERLVPRGPGSG
jgi:uncharacterized RDD family membrane protein YckC